ncbi:MAG TPA: hypothetical protein VLQ93_14825 [Myxococcaceae bacterium]|nr:hypothetical protein [Myxococcaceae bacterium]
MPNRIVKAPGEGDCFFHVAAFFLGRDITDEDAAREVRVEIGRQAERELFQPPYNDLDKLTALVGNSTSLQDLSKVTLENGNAAALLLQRFQLGPHSDPGNGGGCPLPAFVVWLQYSASEIAHLRKQQWARWLRNAHRFLDYTLWGDGAFSAALLRHISGRNVVFHPVDTLDGVQLDPSAINFVHSPNHFDAASFEEGEDEWREDEWRHVSSGNAPPASSDTVHLEIHHLDVGQGDGTLVLLKEGAKVVYSLLVDGGDAGQAPLIDEYMRRAGVKSLDCLVISHYDADHCNGAIELLTHSPLCQSTALFDRGDAHDPHDSKAKDLRTPLKNVLNGRDRSGKAIELEDDREFEDPVEELRMRLHQEAKKRITAGRKGKEIVGEWVLQATGKGMPTVSIQCIAANGFVLDGTTVTPLHSDRENTYSVCLLLRFNEFSYLLCGDATGVDGHDLEGAVAKYVTGTLKLDHVCAAKASHHGSHHSTKRAYVDKLGLRAAFISAGVHRKHQHPRQEPIDALQSAPTIQNFYLSNCGYRRTHIEPSGRLQQGRARVAGDPKTLGAVILRVDHSVAHLHVFWVGYWDQEGGWRLMRHCCVENAAHEELFGVREEEDDDMLIAHCPSQNSKSEQEEQPEDEDDPESRVLAADEFQKQRSAADEALVRSFGLRDPRPLRWQLDGTESAPPRETRTVETQEMRIDLDQQYQDEMDLQEQKEYEDDSSFEDSY